MCPKVRLALAAIVAASLGPARGDDRVPPPPPPIVNPVYTPALPGVTPAPAPLTEDQITLIVDRAVERAVARQSVTTSPQASMQAGSVVYPTQALIQPAPQKVNVLVHPGPIARALAHLGEKLTRLGEPRVRAMSVLPAATLVPTQAQASASPQSPR